MENISFNARIVFDIDEENEEEDATASAWICEDGKGNPVINISVQNEKAFSILELNKDELSVFIKYLKIISKKM